MHKTDPNPHYLRVYILLEEKTIRLRRKICNILGSGGYKRGKKKLRKGKEVLAQGGWHFRCSGQESTHWKDDLKWNCERGESQPCRYLEVRVLKARETENVKALEQKLAWCAQRTGVGPAWNEHNRVSLDVKIVQWLLGKFWCWNSFAFAPLTFCPKHLLSFKKDRELRVLWASRHAYVTVFSHLSVNDCFVLGELRLAFIKTGCQLPAAPFLLVFIQQVLFNTYCVPDTFLGFGDCISWPKLP